jgi:hypothetical protein
MKAKSKKYQRVASVEVSSMQPETIATIKACYPNEWLAIQVAETNRRGAPVKGIMIAHSQDKAQVVQAAQASQAQFLIVTYTGEIPYVLLEMRSHGYLSIQSQR